MISKNKCVTVIAAVAFVAVFFNAQIAGAQRTEGRTVRPVSVAGDLEDIDRAIDERDFTRAVAGSSNYAGLSFTADIGEVRDIVGVIQDHGRWSEDYPGRYRVEVSESSRGRWTRAFEGAGSRGQSEASFAPVRGRFVRVTATDTHGGRNGWSIAELRVIVDERSAPRFPDRDRDRDQPGGSQGMRDFGSAFDRNLNTRATSGTYDYAGAFLTIDLGGEFELSRIIQLHGQWPEDYPGEYKVEVSRGRSEGRFEEVWRGRGEPGRSIAEFRSVTARYVRITALRSRDRFHWWSVAEIQTNRDQDYDREDQDQLVGRVIRRVTAQGLSDASAVSDANNTTRATTGGVNYAGSWIMAELEGSDVVSRVIQIHNPDERDFPGRYRIEVSLDGSRWRTVWQGQGQRGRSAASFSPVRARFVRITAISNHDLQHWWSIYRLRIRG